MSEKILQYLNINAWDYLFGVIITLSLVRLVYFGFTTVPAGTKHQLPSTIGMICLIYAGLVILGFWKWGRVLYSAAGTVLTILFMILMFTHKTHQLYNRVEELYFPALILATVLVFLALRHRVGIMILLFSGYTLMLGTYQIRKMLMEGQQMADVPNIMVFVGWMLTFSAAILLIYLFRTYYVIVPKVKNDVLFPRGFMQQVLMMALTAFVVAACIFIPLQKNMHEQSFAGQQIKILLSKMNPVLSVSEGNGQNMAGAEDSIGNQYVAEQLNEQSVNKDMESIDRERLLAMFLNALPYLIAFGIAVCILVLILTKGRRILWEKRLEKLGKSEAAVNYYHSILRILAKGGHQKAVGTSLREYSKNLDQKVTIFAKTGCAFSALTEIYERIVYGHKAITDEEFMRFQTFYKNIFKNIRTDQKERKNSLRA